MSPAIEIAADRRRKVLDALSQMRDGLLGEDLILRVVSGMGRDTDRTILRADFEFLQQHGCVRIEKVEKPGSEFWLVKLTDDGLLAAQGHLRVSGVAFRTVG